MTNRKRKYVYKGLREDCRFCRRHATKAFYVRYLVFSDGYLSYTCAPHASIYKGELELARDELDVYRVMLA